MSLAEECGFKFWVPVGRKRGDEEDPGHRSSLAGMADECVSQARGGDTPNEDSAELLGAEASGGEQSA